MNHNKNKFLMKASIGLMVFAFILFFSIRFTLAAPPFIIDNSATEGLKIDALVYDTMKAGKSFVVHAHVYNSTSGVNVSNATTECYIHLYNSDGDHLIRSLMEYDNYDFQYIIDGSNTTIPGHYAIEIWCIGDGVGGGERLFFEVVEETKDNYKLYIILGLIAIILLFFSIYVEDYWITAFAGLIFTGLGLYALVNGIDGFKNATTSAMSLLITFFGIYSMVKAGMEYTK